MEPIDRDSDLISKALRHAGLLEDANTYQAAGDGEGLADIVAKALYESVRFQDRIGSAEQTGMRTLLYAVFPDKLTQLIDADKANGWRLADWIENEHLQERWRKRARSSHKSQVDLLALPMTHESPVLAKH